MLASYSQNNQSLISDRIEPNDLSQIPPAYYDGELHGKSNIAPSEPENWNYWEGYCFGNREYWLKQKNRELPNDF